MNDTEDKDTEDKTTEYVVVKKPKKKSDGNTLAVLGIALGAAIGAGIGLVYSRGTGKQNRKDLTKWAHNRLDDVQHKVEGIR